MEFKGHVEKANDMNKLLENISSPNLLNWSKSQTLSATLRPAELPQNGQVRSERRWWSATCVAIKEVVGGYTGSCEMQCWGLTQ